MSLELSKPHLPRYRTKLGTYSPVLTDRITRRPGAGRRHRLCGRLRGAEGDGGAGVQRQQLRAAVRGEHGACQGTRERDAVEEGRGEVPVVEKEKSQPWTSSTMLSTYTT